MLSQNLYEKLISWIMFFVPALLLTTNNGSIPFIVLSILISVGYLYTNRKKVILTRFDLVVFFCLSFYFLGAIPITVYDGTTARYFQGGIRLILCLPIYLSIRTCLTNSKIKFRRHLELGVIVGSIGAFLLAYYQHFIIKMPRVDGFLFSINFGYLACALSFLALTFSFQSRLKPLLLFSSLLCTLAVIFTYTRGAIFAIPLLLVFIVLLNFKKTKKRYILFGGFSLVLAILSLYNTSGSFKARMDYTTHELSLIASGKVRESTSSGYRLQYWYGAIEAFKSSPFIGTPYNMREEINYQLFLDGKINKESSLVSRGHAHSQYFEMIASNGLLGIISLLTIFIFPIIIFVHHYIKFQSNWASSAAVFVAGFAIFGLTEVPLTANLIGSFYGFMLAVFFAIVASEKHNKSVH